MCDMKKLDQVVLQYLHENGYVDTLAAMQRECGQSYAGSVLPQSQLKRLAQSHEAGVKRDEATIRALGSSTGARHALRLGKTVKQLHSNANITAVRWCGSRLLSGGADRHVCLSTPGGERGRGGAAHGGVVVPRVRLDAAVLALDVHEASAYVAAGCLDGTISVMRVEEGGEEASLKEVKRWRGHKKHTHCVRWHPSGRLLATCSLDHSITVYQRHEGADDALTLVHEADCGEVVESVSWASDGALLVAAVRASADIVVFDTAMMQRVLSLPLGSSGTHAINRPNALVLACSPNEQWVAARHLCPVAAFFVSPSRRGCHSLLMPCHQTLAIPVRCVLTRRARRDHARSWLSVSTDAAQTLIFSLESGQQVMSPINPSQPLQWPPPLH